MPSKNHRPKAKGVFIARKRKKLWRGWRTSGQNGPMRIVVPSHIKPLSFDDPPKPADFWPPGLDADDFIAGYQT